MTIATKPTTRPGGRAVVLGASIGGLLAARALTESFAHVTVIDRDDLPIGPDVRRGVPQGEQSHGLLARGREILEEFFPGLTAEITALGGVPTNLQEDCVWINEGRALLRAPSDLMGLCVSRPLLESRIRHRVTAMSSVDVVGHCEALGLVANADRSRVTGVRVLRAGAADEEVLAADLVVDATGRGNRGPTWLTELGYDAPTEEIVKTGIVYVTREYRRRPGDANFDAVVISAFPANQRGGVALATDGDRWLVTLFGMNNDLPPVEPTAFAAFATGLADNAVHELISRCEPLTEPKRFRIPASVRRRYELLSRMPRGYVPIADAFCAFNPAYGQGMTVAAAEAMALRESLRGGRDGGERRYLKAAARVIDVPWDIAVGADLGFPHVEGTRTAKVRILNAYVSRLHRAAERDPAVGLAFLKTINLMAQPQQLFAPRILWRVLRARKEKYISPDSNTVSQPEMVL